MPELVQKIMRSARRSKASFSLLEAIIALLILGVAVVAMFTSWSTTFKQSKVITEVTESEEIDRAVLETAKAFGALNLPTGTYNSSTQLGTWTGAYTGGAWTTGGTAYYSFNGTQLSSSTGAYFSVTVTITDSNVQAGTGTTYTIQNSSLRSIVVTTSRYSDSTVILPMATSIIAGGM